MDDREKVIKGLDVCTSIADGESCPKDCQYYQEVCYGYDQLMRDALELLKEQEAVEPKTEPSAKGYWFTCGACGWWLFEVRDTVHFDDRKRIRFCASCGQAVKWE